MLDEPSEMDLHAYVDGQLDPGRRFAVESYLSENPPLAARVMGELGTRTALRLLADDPRPIPAEMVGKAAALQRRPARAFLRKAVPAGALSLAAAASAFLLLPGRPPAYVDMAVASHRVAMMRAHMASQVEAPTFDAGEILARTSIAVPTLPTNWQVTDVQVFPTDKAPALLVAVKTPEGRSMSIFATREASDAPERPDAVREGLQSVAYWRRGDMSYALTGDADPIAMDDTAEALARYWS